MNVQISRKTCEGAKVGRVVDGIITVIFANGRTAQGNLLVSDLNATAVMNRTHPVRRSSIH